MFQDMPRFASADAARARSSGLVVLLASVAACKAVSCVTRCKSRTCRSESRLPGLILVEPLAGAEWADKVCMRFNIASSCTRSRVGHPLSKAGELARDRALGDGWGSERSTKLNDGADRGTSKDGDSVKTGARSGQLTARKCTDGKHRATENLGHGYWQTDPP